MLIRNKITLQLKNRFLEELKKSKDSGKERGLFICIDENENFTPSEACEGDVCSILMEDPRKACPTGKAQGDFHTHPYLTDAKRELVERGIKVSDEKLINKMKYNIRTFHEIKGVKDMTINSPSYSDVIHALLGRCVNFTKGTVCTSSDIGDDKVECWTVKEMDKDKRDIYCAKAHSELRKMTGQEESPLVEKWIDTIFDRETIDLEKT